MNILLVNPWATDFAAYDLWMKPLGLLYAGSFLALRGHNVRLVDCMDRFQDNRGRDISGVQRKFGTGKFRQEIIEKTACLSQVPRHFNRYGIPVDVDYDRFVNQLGHHNTSTSSRGIHDTRTNVLLSTGFRLLF